MMMAMLQRATKLGAMGEDDYDYDDDEDGDGAVDPLTPGYGQTMPRSVSRTRQHHLNVAREPTWLS